MAFPVMAAIGGAELIAQLLKHNGTPDYRLPPRPTFFGPDYNRVLSIIKQREQARFGGAAGDLRETLANQGILGNQGALTDAFTRMSIGEGQNIADATSGLATSELGSQRAFDTAAYEGGLRKSAAEYQTGVDQRNQLIDLIAGVGKDIGSIYASKKAASNQTDTTDNTDNKVSGKLPNDQEYIQLSDGTLIRNPAYQSDTRRILKVLFGI